MQVREEQMCNVRRLVSGAQQVVENAAATIKEYLVVADFN
jgi:hypothetical protein